MKDKLYDFTKISSYFIWEYTAHHNALDLWYCAEEMGYFFEKNRILTNENLNEILRLGKDDARYINFVRNIAFRLYLFTERPDSIRNWFNAEKLIYNGEWVSAVVNLAVIYDKIRKNDFPERLADSIRTDRIRKLLDS